MVVYRRAEKSKGGGRDPIVIGRTKVALYSCISLLNIGKGTRGSGRIEKIDRTYKKRTE